MSWQAYVDNNLLATGRVTRAAILGQQGGVWASSPNFTLSPQEQADIVKAFGDLNATQSSGIRIAGKKYFTLSVNDRSIYVKQGPNGAVIVKTKQAVLVAVYDAPLQQPEVVPIVEGLADYLISVSY